MNDGHGNQVWVAFTDAISPDGTTWHITVRDGVGPEEIDEMFEALACAGDSATRAGFSLISEHNEFGRKMSVQRLAAMREAKKNQPQPTQPTQQPKLQVVKAGEKTSDGRTRGRSATAQQQAPRGPQQQNARHWDLKQSPVECNKIEIQGKVESPKLAVWCSSPGLKHPAFHCPAQIMLDTIVRKYRVDAETTERMLFQVGTDIDLDPPWLYHWAPSPKDTKYKDLVDIVIPKLAHLERDERLTREQLAATYGDGDPIPEDHPQIPPADEIPPGVDDEFDDVF